MQRREHEFDETLRSHLAGALDGQRGRARAAFERSAHPPLAVSPTRRRWIIASLATGAIAATILLTLSSRRAPDPIVPPIAIPSLVCEPEGATLATSSWSTLCPSGRAETLIFSFENPASSKLATAPSADHSFSNTPARMEGTLFMVMSLDGDGVRDNGVGANEKVSWALRGGEPRAAGIPGSTCRTSTCPSWAEVRPRIPLREIQGRRELS